MYTSADTVHSDARRHVWHRVRAGALVASVAGTWFTTGPDYNDCQRTPFVALSPGDPGFLSLNPYSTFLSPPYTCGRPPQCNLLCIQEAKGAHRYGLHWQFWAMQHLPTHCTLLSPLYVLTGAMLGLGGAWIGLKLQHCGNHGAMSTNTLVNKAMGMCDDWIGGSSLVWSAHRVYPVLKGFMAAQRECMSQEGLDGSSQAQCATLKWCMQGTTTRFHITSTAMTKLSMRTFSRLSLCFVLTHGYHGSHGTAGSTSTSGSHSHCCISDSKSQIWQA